MTEELDMAKKIMASSFKNVTSNPCMNGAERGLSDEELNANLETLKRKYGHLVASYSEALGKDLSASWANACKVVKRFCGTESVVCGFMLKTCRQEEGSQPQQSTTQPPTRKSS